MLMKQIIQNGCESDALIVGSSSLLVDMYAKPGSIDGGHFKVVEYSTRCARICWSLELLSLWAQAYKALEFFQQMQQESEKPEDPVTFAGYSMHVQVCIVALEEGRCAHEEIFERLGCESNI